MDRQWKLVPVEPTETMVINGFESEPNECFTDDEVWEQYQDMSGCQQAAFRAKLCWAAMLASAPEPPPADAGEVARLTAEREALQLRLNEADQLIDDFSKACEWAQEEDSGIWNSSCGSTWSFNDDGPTENGMNFCHCCGMRLIVRDAVVESEPIDDWQMNPCKQGHRDVGADGGVAHCYQCDEKIEAATTQEAFERWNATHPAAQA